MGVHEKLFDKNKTNKCTYCGKTFKKSGNLKEHIKVIHEGQRDHKCYNCGNNFSRPENLKAHIKAVHEGIKNHKCDYCQKRFSKSGDLKKHIKGHNWSHAPLHKFAKISSTL